MLTPPGGVGRHRATYAAAVKLRSATPADIGDVLALWRAAGAEPSETDDEAGVSALLAHDPDALVVADQDGRLIGTVIVGWDGWRGSIYRLAVDPAWRRQRVALALVGQAEHRLRERGARRVALIVVASERGAMAFWRSCGYQQQADRARFIKNFG